jgi:hypothetical protein
MFSSLSLIVHCSINPSNLVEFLIQTNALDGGVLDLIVSLNAFTSVQWTEADSTWRIKGLYSTPRSALKGYKTENENWFR